MSIEKFIAEKIFRARAEAQRILVIYDPEQRYLEIVKTLPAPQLRVICADESWVVAREQAMELLLQLASQPNLSAVIWTPVPLPTTDRHRQSDPFAVAAVIGGAQGIFPAGADDEYQALCLKAYPDFHAKIHELFRDGRTPAFTLINQLQQGQQWPELQAALGGTTQDRLSSREIIEKILIDQHLEGKLQDGGDWIAELRQVLEAALGLSDLPVMRRSSEFRSYLWRVILFSEFVFDGSDDLPDVLKRLPRASVGAKEMIYDLCDRMRGHSENRETYIQFAQMVEEQLQLVRLVGGMASLGFRDTFAFEEKLFLDRFCRAISQGDLATVGKIVAHRLSSLWIALAERQGRRSEWQAAKAAVELLEAAASFTEPPRQLAAITAAYQQDYHQLDRAHRLLEQAVGQRSEEHDGLDQVLNLAREKYRDCVSRLHATFLRAVEVEGWPPTGAGLLENGRIFAEIVEPLLAQGRKVAYLLIDSLRYELAADLKETLLLQYPTELRLSYAQLPTYTEVGMASLMPGAKAQLSLREKDLGGGKRKLVTHLGDRPVTDPTTRFNYLRELKGDQCAQEKIERFRQAGRPSIDARVKLYLVRGSDIDEAGHATESQAMQQLPAMMTDISKALAKLTQMGFETAVIVTDHGFMLKPQYGAGDGCTKPAGDWLVEKARCLLGTGGRQDDPANCVIDRAKLGIRGDFSQFVTPRAFLAYDGTTGYFHEGLSPQENLLPCMIVQLKVSVEPAAGLPQIYLNYRGKDTVTTRRPSITVDWKEEDLFAQKEISLLIQVVDPDGNEVAGLQIDDNVDPTTQRVILSPRKATKFGIILKDGFAGKFTVKALDGRTLLEYASLSLTTNFTY